MPSVESTMVPPGLSAILHVTPSSVPVPSPLSLLLMLCAPLCTLSVRHMRPENADDVLKVGRSFLVGVWRRETVRWKAIAYSYPVH